VRDEAPEGFVWVQHEEWGLAPLPPSNLPYDDGVPSESNWHRLAVNLLIESLNYCWREPSDFFAGGNMGLYFSTEQIRKRDFRGPDFFFVAGVERYRPRHYWAAWDEDGRSPDVIVELNSPSKAEDNRFTKKDIYENTLKVGEYYLYDPATEQLEGWRLGQGGVTS
jgi:Uma2 family endonuclease